MNLLFILVACARTATAADIMEAYEDAAATDPQLRVAAAERLADQEVLPQARALLLPQLSATFSRGRTFDFSSDTPGVDSTFDTHNYGINLAQFLYNREAVVRIRQARPVALQADAQFTAARQDLILRVAERYFNVLRALEDLIFRIADKNAIARQLEQAQQRFEVGLITVTDVFEAQARFDRAVAAEIAARNQLANALEALREVTGEFYKQIQVLDVEAPLGEVEPADIEAWVALALANNPDVAAAVLGVEIARDAIALQRAGHYPTLTLTAGYFDNDSGSIGTSGARVGLQLEIPLYLGGAVTSRTREAAYQYEGSKENREQVQRQVVRQVRDAYRGLETARSRIKALEQAVVSNESSLEATEAGFEVGTRTIVDVLNSQRNLLEARRDLAVSRYDYIVNRLRLLRAAGRIAVRHLEAINDWLRVPEDRQPMDLATDTMETSEAPETPAPAE